MNDVIEVFYDADLRNGLDGLSVWAEKNSSGRVKINKLKPGQFLVFLNTKQSKLKVMVGFEHAHPIVATVTSRTGRLELRAVRYIPQAFSGGRLNWDKATEKALAEILPEKKEPKDGR